MASEFQRCKIASVFDAMDADGRGYLREADFVALADRWTTQRGLRPGSEQYARLRAIMLGWWASLSSAAADAARGGCSWRTCWPWSTCCRRWRMR